MSFKQIVSGALAMTLVLGITGCGALFESSNDDPLEMFRVKNDISGKSVDPNWQSGNRSGEPNLSSASETQTGPWTNDPAGGAFSYSDFGKPIAGLMFEPVYFKFDQSRIDSSEQSKLDKVAEYLLAHSGTGVVIEGHCDDQGSDEYNRGLGERRALASREYLLAKGIREDRIRTISYGEEKPAVPNSGEEARAKNRRDEFIGVTLNK